MCFSAIITLLNICFLYIYSFFLCCCYNFGCICLFVIIRNLYIPKCVTSKIMYRTQPCRWNIWSKYNVKTMIPCHNSNTINIVCVWWVRICGVCMYLFVLRSYEYMNIVWRLSGKFCNLIFTSTPSRCTVCTQQFNRDCSRERSRHWAFLILNIQIHKLSYKIKNFSK